MRLIFTEQAWSDYLYWLENDSRQIERVNRLVKECLRTPFAGVGKPEPLKGELRGWWSRRIDQEHRLVYKTSDDGLLIAQCRYHY